MPSIADYQLALAEAEKDCPACKDGIADRSYGHFDLDHSSPGKVFLLEGVREKCPNRFAHAEHDGRPYQSQQIQPCPDCQGRGWIPSGNLLRYIEAVLRLDPLNEIELGPAGGGYRVWIAAGHRIDEAVEDTLELAVLKALAEVLGVKEE